VPAGRGVLFVLAGQLFSFGTKKNKSAGLKFLFGGFVLWLGP